MKKPLTKEEHEVLAKDLRKAQEILEPYMQKLYDAYGVNSLPSKQLKKTLNLLSSKLCCSLEDRWFYVKNKEDNSSPYYGYGKKAWI